VSTLSYLRLYWLKEVQVGTSDHPISFGSVPLDCSVVK